ncbi:MAG: hypothetical protein KDC80_00180 [Saprospiraceae bacterium]|nr:hypothetical protein [Saprospiraceae bacterium]
MQKTKLFRVLLSFSLIELNRLLRFIDDGQWHEQNKIKRLIGIAIGLIRENAAEKVEKEEVWNVLHNDEDPYDDVRFRKLCSDALQVVERFLSSEAYFNDMLLESATRLKALSRKELAPLYNTQLNRVNTLISRFPERGSDYYHFRYQVEKNAFTFRQSVLQRFKIANIDAILDNLDTFYIIEKLKYYCEVLSRRTFLKHEYRNRLIDEILSLIQNGEFDHVPLIRIYYQIVLTHLYPEDESFYYELKSQLKAHNSILPGDQMKEIYTSALNYCTRKINQGKDEFILEAFETYKQLLVKELLYDRDQLSHWTFKNLVVLALRLGEYHWAENFIHEYKDKIPQQFRLNAVSYNLAQLYFYQRKYKKVLELLQTVEYEDATYNLGAKSMLFATYYEMQEWEALHSLGESFKVFIHRRKNIIPEGRRNSYLNLIKLTLKLHKLNVHEVQKITSLMQKTESSGQEIASANWLKEKINEKLHYSDHKARHLSVSRQA